MLFTRTGELVQRPQVARRELGLESAIAKLDKYPLIILDDIAYVSRPRRARTMRKEPLRYLINDRPEERVFQSAPAGPSQGTDVCERRL